MASNGFPEGTDSIVTGAGVGEADERPFAGNAAGGTGQGGTGYTGATGGATGTGSTGDAKEKIADKAAGLKDQAADKARVYAVQGKDKATDALDGVVRLVDDAAAQIDDKVGEQYGAYARQAAQAIAGLSSTLKDKDVDELFTDARELVRQSPAIAIGAAAALGFVVARVIKAGADAAASAAARGSAGTNTPPPTSTAPSTTTTQNGAA